MGAVQSSHISRAFYPSIMLRDGRFFVTGGEIVSPGSDHATVEIYDPVANT
jgi:hypothetical protein